LIYLLFIGGYIHTTILISEIKNPIKINRMEVKIP
jgi:hypothetical protein